MATKTTAEILIQKYGSKHVHLLPIAEEYLGLHDIKTINRKAAKNDLGGIRPFRVRQSKDSPWIVDLEQVADVLDRKAVETRG
jgi:Pyocin activator protein PrtN